ncbi:MAG TPA: hypothetical protein VHK47_23730 [Polyangia bacterium]|jgi:hypothetical protein|nr:hypothetical protein [Polyangia bacterium]
MLYLAASFFVLALITIGLDLSKLEFARGAGMLSNLFLLAALACLAVSAFRAKRGQEGDARAH